MKLPRTGLRVAWRTFYRHVKQRRRAKEDARSFGVKGLFRDDANRLYRDEIKTYWREHYGRPVYPLWHIAYANVIGIKDVRYIPTHEYREEIVPFFNELDMRPAFRDKNLSDVFLSYTQAPQTIIKRMHGRYYGADNQPLTSAVAKQRLLTGQHDWIVKPSQTDDGYCIGNLTVVGKQMRLNDHTCTPDDLETQYGRNFIVQERIVQHTLMAEVHPSSVNTIRMITFRWQDEIQVLMAFARFGNHGRLTDNAGTGGLCCGINECGRLNDTAVDMTGKIYERHPATGYSFANRISIPDYDKFCKFALDLHRQIFHFNIVSWDIAVGYQGEPVFLEVNFIGAVHIYQFACKRPMFGDLTKDVLEMIRDNRRTA
jgi:hypothetical protein